MNPDIARAAALLREARRVLFVTGAGISADSGLPTYRGVGGLYDDVATDEGVPIEVALSGATMRRDPALCWKYIAQIEAACRGARPNRGHEVIAELQETRAVTVITQNVDGLHRAAGSRELIEIHGNIHRLRCDACGWHTDVSDYAKLVFPPRCPTCRAFCRPDVVLFGEMLAELEVARLRAAVARGFDLVFSIGTTSVFPYVAYPVVQAHRLGLPSVEINPGNTEVSHLATVRIAARAAAALDAIWVAARG